MTDLPLSERLRNHCQCIDNPLMESVNICPMCEAADTLSAQEKAMEEIQKVRDGYASQMKFCDIEALGYFREFVRRLDAALKGSPA